MTTKQQYEAAVPVMLEELKPGDTVIVDDGFTCLPPWAESTVMYNGIGELFIHCETGLHYLEGQCDEEGAVLVGVRKIP